MMNNMAVLLIISVERKNHTILERLGKSAGALPEKSHRGVCFLKLVVRIVKNNRDSVFYFILQIMFNRGKSVFGGFDCEIRNCKSVLIKINIKMFRFNIIPSVVFVLHLILPELSENESGERKPKK